ncbi:hypothetical protein B0H13DRAFT_2478506 [Mycena leptocephala]|nr:hypothetical protein B0H13DRAFT_2478506 [Mycena leptocephala]
MYSRRIHTARHPDSNPYPPFCMVYIYHGERRSVKASTKHLQRSKLRRRIFHTQPASGLSAARMSALLTYRSRDSFESRFGCWAQVKVPIAGNSTLTPPGSPPPRVQSPVGEAVPAHNDGYHKMLTSQKFTARFDANCYIHITRKLDTHDVARGR